MGQQFTAELGDHSVYARPDVAALFGDRAEGPAFLRALGNGTGAEMSSIVVSDGTSPVAAASLVWLPFDFVSDAPKPIKSAVHAMRKLVRSTGYLKFCGPGGLHTGEPQIVISGRLDLAARDAAFAAMLDVAEAEGRRRKTHYHSLMDLSQEDAAWAAPMLQARGYYPMEGIAMPWQHLPFATIDEYLASHGGNLRYKMHKKFKRAIAEIEIVETHTVDDRLEAEIDALALSIHQHAMHNLGGIELMPPGFYRQLAETGNVTILLYRLAGRTVGFCFMIEEGEVLCAKAVGLSWPEAEDYNLIYYNLYCVIEAAIRLRKPWVVLGQGGYPTKLLYGAQLVRRTSFLKGCGPVAWFLPLFASRLDEMNPARMWKEVMDPANYFDADPSAPQPPVKRIWVPDQSP